MLAQFEESISLPAGYSIRPTQMEDADEVTELLNDAEETLTGQRPYTAQRQRDGWKSPNYDLAYSSRVVLNAEGAIVGYAAVWDTNPIPANIWVYARVHPDFEGQGIGTALRVWVEERARETLPRVPEDIKVTMESGALREHESALELLAASGMEEIRHFYRMAIDLKEAPPEPTLPDDIEIRPWSDVKDNIALKDIAIADNDAFRDHWGYVEQPLDEMLKHWEHWFTTDDTLVPELCFLALDNGKIAGLSLCLNKSQNIATWGYVDSLAVLRPWRRKGIALALLHHTFGEFYKMGYERVELHVDASSLTGATRLYERAGMHVDEESIDYVKVLRDGRDITTRELAD